MTDQEINKFTKLGFVHEFIRKIGSWSLYKRSKNDFHHFEIVKILTAPKDVYMGNTLTIKQGSLIYPSTSEWGSKGFTVKTLERAGSKANELNQRDEENKAKKASKKS